MCFTKVRLSFGDLALCAAWLWVGASSAEPPPERNGAPVGQPARASWDRQALWASAALGPTADRPFVDADRDGIDDATELALAKAYFPYYSVDPRDGCSRHGVVFRLMPHPTDPDRLAVWYVVLYERDCGRFGLGAHVGDDEAFGAVVDPALPPPAGLLSLRAISHQSTLWQRETSCGAIPGGSPCDMAEIAGRPFPVVFSSSNKHAHYVSQWACNTWPNDLGACWLSTVPDEPPLVNAGEPHHPLCSDLTDDGFIQEASGWTETALMHFDPWSNANFGAAGNVTDDLTDEAFLIDSSPTVRDQAP